jgi:hypothetical protein
MLTLLLTTSGHRKSFHSAANWIMNSDARAGLAFGRMMRQ